METITESRPRTTHALDLTIWIHCTEAHGQSWRPWRGPHTVSALSRVLSILDALGASPSLEIEWRNLGPVPTTIVELCELGIVREEPPTRREYAVVVAAQYLESVERTTRRRVHEKLIGWADALARIAARALSVLVKGRR
jgi:hypothetical protein